MNPDKDITQLQEKLKTIALIPSEITPIKKRTYRRKHNIHIPTKIQTRREYIADFPTLVTQILGWNPTDIDNHPDTISKYGVWLNNYAREES